MNLYRIDVEHFSQKDSHLAIETFVTAKDDESVYRWLDKEKNSGCWSKRDEEDGLYDIYNDDLEIAGQESYKEKMLRLKGELNDEDRDCSDLYYGKTFYGWEQMTGAMTDVRAAALEGLGILVRL